jgi:glycosyltransferase involved in cell wall biosynthesis
MKILMLVGWKVKNCSVPPWNLQPPDYNSKSQPYWFFRHLTGKNVEVDVADTSGISRFRELFEKKVLHFYIWQGVKALNKSRKYDLILSHGAQSGVFLAFVRSLFGINHPPHIIIDIGSLNGGRQGRLEIALFKLAMKSVTGLIYHVRQQKEHYQRYFPELSKRSRFVAFGTDIDLFLPMPDVTIADYVLSVGYAKRDWRTLISAYKELPTPKPKLRILGDPNPIKGNLPQGVEAIGRVPFRSMMEHINAARFVVAPLPYIAYAVGQMTVLQSMAMGKAVIVSQVPSMIDYVTDGHNGLFYVPGDSNDLGNKMQYLIKNQDTVRSLGANARATTEGKFNEHLMANDIWKALSDLISPR